MQVRLLITAFAVTMGAALATQAQSIQSSYTNLAGRSCRTIKEDSSGAGYWLGQCPGVAGYKLLLEEGDLRQNLTVVTPRGKKQSLDLWSVVASGFSRVGDKAEWRLKKQRGGAAPIALIVRFIVSIDPEDSTRTKSYLAVSKITSTEICVTHKIEPGPSANEAARKAADEAGSKPCLASPE